MKSKIFSGMALAAGLLMGFASCANDDNDFSTSTTLNQENDANKADYTVIFWGAAGGNDPWTVSDMAQLLLNREDGKINDKVNFVGCLEPSDKYITKMNEKNLGGTLEFELGTKLNTSTDTLSVFKSIAGVVNETNLEKDKNADIPNLYSEVMHSMKSIKANSEYNIYKSVSLAQFIAKAAKEHPAKNYVLMFYGHGNGYIPATEGAAVVTSRGCVHSSSDENMILHLEDVTNAINNSGVKIQTVFYQCCNMATLENFAGMKDCTDYVIASAEPTNGGYYPTFMTYLNEAGSTAEGMKSACKKIIDYYKDNCTDIPGDPTLSSQGFYDLSKTDELLSSVKQAAAWFTAAAKSNPKYMEDVVYNSVNVFATTYTAVGIDFLDYDKVNALKKKIRKFFDDDKITVTSANELTQLVTVTTCLNLPDNMCGTCFASMMEAALSDNLASEATGLDLSSLKSIYNKYMTTLKSMAYIRCNGEESNDAAYRFASPSVNLFCLNEQGYFKTQIGNFIDKETRDISQAKINEAVNEIGTFAAAGDQKGAYNKFIEYFGGTGMAVKNASLAAVKANYQNTAFDKATGWSQVMENIKCNPMLVFNPTRYDATH